MNWQSSVPSEPCPACGRASAPPRCRISADTSAEPEPGPEAVDVLAGSPARLEFAQALAALGSALRRSGRPGEALHGVESLTPSERRVAGMAADGTANKVIAQTLYVMPKTVELHLSSAYRKLGIRSRRELPAALVPR
jgi:DNA-binding NarL/FixJ family response regulator